MLKTITSASLLGAAAIATSLLSTGCPDRSIATVDPAQGRVEYKDIPQTLNRAVDILFLVDNSNSMADKQANLAANFSNFINVLETIQGGLPDVHIGVVDSDMGTSATNGIGGDNAGCSGQGDGGKLQVRGAAVGQVSGLYISDVADAGSAGGRNRNYTGTLATVFGEMAQGVGDQGCGFEQHLEAVKHALDPSSSAASTNAGFIRADAFLAVIIIADEDDCSLADKNLIEGTDSSQFGPLESFRCTQYGITCDTGGTTPTEMGQVGPKSGCHSNEDLGELTKVQGYIDFLRGLKSDPTDVVVALIGGPATPVATELRTDAQHPTAIPALAHSCTFQDAQGDEVADPSVRQSQFLNGFPNRESFTTICQQDLSDGLTLIAELVKDVIGTPCIDAELATPYDCSVSDVSNPGQASQTETILPACINPQGTGDSATADNAPCWVIVTDTANCPTHPGANGVIENPENLSLSVIRQGMATPPNDHVIANCVTKAEGAADGGS